MSVFITLASVITITTPRNTTAINITDINITCDRSISAKEKWRVSNNKSLPLKQRIHVVMLTIIQSAITKGISVYTEFL